MFFCFLVYMDLSLSSIQRNTWKNGNESIYQYDCILKNIGARTLNAVKVVVSCDTIVNLWNLNKNTDGSYGLPTWMTAFKPNDSLSFGFIASGRVPSVFASVVPTPVPVVATPVPVGPTPVAVVPTPVPVGHSTNPITPSMVNIKAPQVYTRAMFVEDLKSALSVRNNANSAFWDDSKPPGISNHIDSAYYGIASALFVFFADCGFNIRSFFRMCLVNSVQETTLKPICAYSPEVMQFKWATGSMLSPGFMQTSAVPQCIGYIHWGRPIVDITGKITTTPLPPANDPFVKEYKNAKGGFQNIAWLRLDHIVYHMLVWGWAQRNLSCIGPGNSYDQMAYNALARNEPNGIAPPKVYTYRDLLYIWNGGGLNLSPSENDYVGSMYKHWLKAGWSESEWNEFTNTRIPVIRGGIGIGFRACNVNFEAFSENIALANLRGQYSPIWNDPELVKKLKAVCTGVASGSTIGPAVKNPSAYIEMQWTDRVPSPLPLKSLRAIDYPYLKWSGGCGNMSNDGKGVCGEGGACHEVQPKLGDPLV
jgi:hypothetical protein